MERKITIELVRFGKVDSYQTVGADEAKQLLSLPMNPGNRYRIALPDRTGEVFGDDARYANDCEACGFSNPFANA